MIILDSLTKQYGGFTAVDHVTFRAEPGRVTGFLGPNGAGKSTTMRILVGLTPASSGTTTVLGRRYADLPNPGREIGVLLDASAQHAGRTGREILTLAQRTMRAPRGRVDEMLDLVSLSDEESGRRVRDYSLGMRQRLGIAAAMLGDPRVLILDEPANGLDPEGIRWMRDLLKTLAGEGRTVLVSSHLLSEMQLLADDVVILAAGRLIQQGPMDHVVGSLGAAVQVRVRTPDPAKLTTALAPFSPAITPLPDGALMVTGVEPAQVGHAAFTAQVELHELTGEKADLEQVFLQLTAGKAGIR
jgi:ABC-2 type transport system ATP-binding protein